MIKELVLRINGQDINVPKGIPNPPPGYTGINKILGGVFIGLFLIAILLTLIYLIWGGIDFITSSGDKNKIHAAREKITFAIIGLVIVLLSLFIIRAFGSVLNFKLF